MSGEVGTIALYKLKIDYVSQPETNIKYSDFFNSDIWDVYEHRLKDVLLFA